MACVIMVDVLIVRYWYTGGRGGGAHDTQYLATTAGDWYVPVVEVLVLVVELLRL